MASAYLPLYQTIVLAMLHRAEVTLTRAQVMDFVLTSGYTNYMTLQETFAALSSQHLVREETARGRTYLYLTPTGEETLLAVFDGIRPDIIRDIDNYLSENRIEIRNESALHADYTRLPNGTCEVRCEVRENGRLLYGLALEVPTEALAGQACENFKNRSGEIYRYIIEKLTN